MGGGGDAGGCGQSKGAVTRDAVDGIEAEATEDSWARRVEAGCGMVWGVGSVLAGWNVARACCGM